MVVIYLFPSHFTVSSSASPMFYFIGETDIENRPMDMVGREKGEAGKYGESDTEIDNTICQIDSQREFVV